MDDPLEMEALENQHDEKLDAQLASVGMEQNRAKGEVLPCFQGKNSCRYNQAIFGKMLSMAGKPKKVVRYLGGWGHCRGNNRVEIEKHLQAMDRGWCALGGFWRSKLAIVSRK